MSGDGLLENAPVALCATSLNGEILAHNPVLPQWLGLSGTRGTAGLVGRNLIDWLTPAGRLLYESRLMPELMRSGYVREVVIEVRGRNGQPASVILNANLIEQPTGDRRVYVALFDAATRIAFERQLVEARRAADLASSQLRLLQEATSRLAVAKGLDDLGLTLTDSSGRATQAAWTTVRIIDTQQPGSVLAEHTWGSRPGGIELFGSAPIPAEMVVCRNAVDIRLTMPEAAEALRAAGVESLVVTPIVRAGDGETVVLGAIHSWFRRSRSLEADVLDTLQALAGQAERVIEHLQLQDRVRHRSLHDVLTGLPNRQLFEERVGQMLTESRRTASSVAVLFLDLDGFKAINDQLGHRVGDDVLVSVAGRLREACRAGEIVARLGGDEFVIAIAHENESGVAGLAERALERVREPLAGEAGAFPLSASLGSVIYHPNAEAVPTAGELIAAADAAMYEAKRSGKNRTLQRAWSAEAPTAPPASA
ncbi:diguanylate cyclase domain-containing protein [Leucobacter sp. W1478]|uniref:diguanylate cyclase domain-containing protein n=1 Tax=Leucobacter sp. W1478 TaxID=3439065 RepID=UPI003F3E0B15